MSLAGKRVLVAGGGLGGLAAAFRLAFSGAPEAEITLVEAGDRPGGVVRTVGVGDFRFELGPNSFTASSPLFFGFAGEAGLTPSIQPSRSQASRRFVFHGGRVHPLPRGPWGLLTLGLLPWRDRWALLTEGFRTDFSSHPQESLGGWIGRRFGRTVVERLLDPFVSGVYGGDVNRLGAEDSFPALYRESSSRGSVIRGALALARKASSSASPPRRGLFSLTHGLEELPQALARLLGNRLKTGTTLRVIVPDGGKWRCVLSSSAGEVEDTWDGVILALPAPTASALLRPAAPLASSALDRVEMAPMRVACLGIRADSVTHPCNGFGMLVPRSQGLRLLGTLWPSSCFPGRAPEGHLAMNCFIGGVHDLEVRSRSPEQDRPRLLEELAVTLGLRGDPVVERWQDWPSAIPQYVPGHRKRMNAAEESLLPLPPLALAGSYRGGISMEDTLRSGQTAAGTLVQRLTGSG